MWPGCWWRMAPHLAPHHSLSAVAMPSSLKLPPSVDSIAPERTSGEVSPSTSSHRRPGIRPAHMRRAAGHVTASRVQELARLTNLTAGEGRPGVPPLARAGFLLAGSLALLSETVVGVQAAAAWASRGGEPAGEVERVEVAVPRADVDHL